MSNARRILILEGNDALAQSAAEHFRRVGWSPVTARDASRGLPSARESQAEVIVLNSSLPGGAMQLLGRLKANINTTAVPIVAVTAMPEVYLNAGAQRCVTDFGDFAALEKAADACCAKPARVEQAPAAVILDDARLSALKQTNLLDSPPDPLLDGLTRMAARLVKAPVALVTLVDAHRQFFKSQSGLNPPLSTDRQNDLSYSFCQWVVSGEEPLMVEDARDHPVLRDNPAVSEYGISAYLGVPLKAAGKPIGSFCAANTEPQNWSVTDLKLLQNLASVAESFGLPPKASGNEALGVIVGSIQGARSVLNDAALRLEHGESDLLWKILSHLGRRLAELKPNK